MFSSEIKRSFIFGVGGGGGGQCLASIGIFVGLYMSSDACVAHGGWVQNSYM